MAVADFATFWADGSVEVPMPEAHFVPYVDFARDPTAHRLNTPTGRIELFSATIGGFGYDDCPGHPAWLPSTEPPSERHPLTLIANQPATRLHSQLDFGSYSQSQKIDGREAVRLNPADARWLGIATGDIVRLFNDRGACLAAAVLSDQVMEGVIHLPTGAWYDPEPGPNGQPLCMHGNPNVLTRDVGTSKLAQGCCGQVTVVACEKFTGPTRSVRAFDPPEPAARKDS